MMMNIYVLCAAKYGRVNPTRGSMSASTILIQVLRRRELVNIALRYSPLKSFIDYMITRVVAFIGRSSAENVRCKKVKKNVNLTNNSEFEEDGSCLFIKSPNNLCPTYIF